MLSTEDKLYQLLHLCEGSKLLKQFLHMYPLCLELEDFIDQIYNEQFQIDRE